MEYTVIYLLGAIVVICVVFATHLAYNYRESFPAKHRLPKVKKRKEKVAAPDELDEALNSYVKSLTDKV